MSLDGFRVRKRVGTVSGAFLPEQGMEKGVPFAERDKSTYEKELNAQVHDAEHVTA